MNVLVLGIGNVLMTDDSVGIRVINELERRFRFPDGVELLDGGTSGIELLSYIADKDYLIIVDAIKSDFPPGTVVKVEGEDVPAKFMTRISPHQLGLSDLLAAAMLTGELPKQMVLFGIEPKRVELGLEMTEEVKGSFEKLVGVVVDELKRIGCPPEPLEECAFGKESIWKNV
ncbi:MAG: HyaD/HybD family hydrogenase maturation endopeptidase [Nitrospiraceae bacterium]|nr:MAG: HyaD/HybD family hydrogenase maturation endopeptidase [Nitrospiraceae bacterium]